MRWIFAFAVLVMVCDWQSAAACGGRERLLATQAVASDPSKASAAIEKLRGTGPAGLDALFVVHAAAIAKALEPQTATAADGDPAWQRIRQAIDTVGGQRDCYTSHLYWYTDLEEAKAAARQANKPILSLRLLGRLTDEYSCANSRFFRSSLYANAEVGRVLGDRFILHWQSVRPVPVVTIDFGDGRTLQRTVTGNSVHYVLDTSGRPVDALPGLYGPRAFLQGLALAEQICRSVENTDTDSARVLLAEYHRGRLQELRRAWAQDLRKLGVASADGDSPSVALPDSDNPVQPVVRPLATLAKADKAAPAVKAARMARPKSAVEAPILAAVLSAANDLPSKATSDDLWNAIARLHAADVELDDASLRLIARQQPTALEAVPLAIGKEAVERPLVRLIRNFQQAVALDTVRDEFLLHRQIHDWFAAGQVADLSALNERVYGEVFLTPSSDPWLGLMPADTYSALENNGVGTTSLERPPRLQ